MIKDRMEVSELIQVNSRFDPTPLPFTWQTREKFDDNGNITHSKRRKVFSSIFGGIVSYGPWEQNETVKI